MDDRQSKMASKLRKEVSTKLIPAIRLKESSRSSSVIRGENGPLESGTSRQRPISNFQASSVAVANTRSTLSANASASSTGGRMSTGRASRTTIGSAAHTSPTASHATLPESATHVPKGRLAAAKAAAIEKMEKMARSSAKAVVAHTAAAETKTAHGPSGSKSKKTADAKGKGNEKSSTSEQVKPPINMIHYITDETHYQSEMDLAGDKLVVVYFTASWCKPCQTISPLFGTLPLRYPQVYFMKIDVDDCITLAIEQQISSIPTFVFFRNQEKLESLQGSEFPPLVERIDNYTSSVSQVKAEPEDYGPGLMLLNEMISNDECECLNESTDHVIINCFNENERFLRSSIDEQLMLSLTFLKPVKIHSIKFRAPKMNGPKDVKLFVNHAKTIAFNQANEMEANQELTLTEEHLETGEPVVLRAIRFQNVRNLQMFVKSNQTRASVTQINYIGIIGAQVQPNKVMARHTILRRLIRSKKESKNQEDTD